MRDFSKFIAIPFWIETLFKRNKMPLRDILDYQQIRKVASPEDLAGLVSLQGIIFSTLGDQDYYANTLLSSWEQTALNEQKTELVSVISPLSYSERVIEDVTSRLSLGELEQANPDQPVFRLADFDRKMIGVMVTESFLAQIANGEIRFNLIRSMIKAMQIYNAPHEVASTNLYRSYLELLETRLQANTQSA